MQETISDDRNDPEPFDFLIIGGGILGCGIARDAALRGLRVALIEKEDFGYGTSSRSTRLIHGGLRYLEQYDFALVRQDLREREILLKIAPHRVTPLPFLVPLYHRSLFYRLKLRFGMNLYDLLSYDKSLPKYRFLSREQTLQEEPNLSREGLQGAALYYDAQASFPERLCLDNVLDAAAHGAQIINHMEVLGLLRNAEGNICGVRVRDALTGAERVLRGECVINATGPWRDRLTEQLSEHPEKRLRLTKGIHFTAPPATKNALVLFSPTDGRLAFVIPWLGYAWVGTTDTDFTADLDTVRANGEDMRYLLKMVRTALPTADWNTVYYTNAGVRALVRENREGASESAVSRKHRIVVSTQAEGMEGVLSVLGGKLTAYRDIAREAVEKAWELSLSRKVAQRPKEGQPSYPRSLPPCQTATRPLPGGDFTDREALLIRARTETASYGLEPEQADHLVFLYGTRYCCILELLEKQPDLNRRITPASPDILAEIVYAVREEFAQTASDFLMRRTPFCFTPDQGLSALPAVVATMGERLSWNPERCEAEATDYRRQIALTQAFRQE